MAFQFSLATVLRFRGTLEKREESMLQKVLYELSQTLQAIARTDAEIVESNTSRVAQRFKPSIGRQLHVSYGQIKDMMQSRKELETQLEKLEQLRDTQLKVYEAARRDREILTEMREERRGAYESEMARREQKILDDNYLARRGRTDRRV
jgi:flagellar export protein FliJ